MILPDKLLPVARPVGGFTLIEVLVVLVIMGLLVGLVIGNGPPHSARQSARAAAAELAQGLRLARSEAIASNHPVSLLVDLSSHVWLLGNRPPHPLPRDLDIAVLTTRGEARGGKQPGIRFDPDGSSTGGQIALSLASDRFQIGVDWLSGRVQVVEAKVRPGEPIHVP